MKRRLGLALGGGGLRGLAHIGVLQVLHQQHIPVTWISGTSAGSIIAALYASGMDPYQMEKEALALKPADYLDYNLGGLLGFLWGKITGGSPEPIEGIIKGNRLERTIYRLTGGKYLRDCRMPLAIISCNIDNGYEVIFTNQQLPETGDYVEQVHEALLSKAARASSSIPATFVPSDFQGRQLVDGGVKSIVPIRALKQMQADYILAVNLGQETYHTPVQGIHEIVSRTISILTYETSEADQELLADLVVYPGVQGVKLDDLSQARDIIQAGRRAMREKLPELKKGLA
ncbi:patatin-like phospholipase family protein [Syntrophomonas palmitatica]|uniref:patatin-like phospholipase family protein n=1 Tax=Syntrophomonas palmitatica TaxID=402877 RepID=UPI0006D02F1F|nr:patatin-like phospholipase family protein [Syntrophomonas palmitatica]